MLIYILWIITGYIAFGLAIGMIEVLETWRWPIYFGRDRLGITKEDFVRVVFLWLPLLYLGLTAQKNQNLAKIKLPHLRRNIFSKFIHTSQK